MNLITLIVVLVVVGVAMYLINSYVPMDPKIKNILNVAVVIFVLLWLLVTFLGETGIGNVGSTRLD
jgi:bacteriorhodopsin